MLALHSPNLPPGLTMQQANNPHTLPSTATVAPGGAATHKPQIVGVPPQLIPMATVPQSQFVIRGGYTLLPPLAPLGTTEGASFGGLAPFHAIGRPIAAIPYYPPSDFYHRDTMARTTTTIAAAPGVKESVGAAPGLCSHGNASLAEPSSSSATPRHGMRSPQNGTGTATTARALGISPPVDVAGLVSSREKSLPNSLDLSSSSRTATTVCSPATTPHSVTPSCNTLGSAATTPTPDHTPQTDMPHPLASSSSLIRSPPSSSLDSRTRDLNPSTPSPTTATSTVNTTSSTSAAASTFIQREASSVNSAKGLPSGGSVDDSYTCSRPKSADAVTEDGSSSVFLSSMNPYPINALIDAPTSSLGRGSRTSSLSSSISSFRFGGSLNKLWASHLSLSNKVNMKSTGNLNAETATMPSLGNQYYALGGSLPELSLTSLTRLLPSSSSATDCNTGSAGLHGLAGHQPPPLFTLAPLYVYSSQQHLGTPIINPNGSITFGSFLSSASSLCGAGKSTTGSSSSLPGKPTDPVIEGCGREAVAGGGDCVMTDTGIKKEEGEGLVAAGRRGRIVPTTATDVSPGAIAASTAGEIKMAAAYSPITAHMIHPHGTLNRAVPIMTLPTFGTLTSSLSPGGAGTHVASAPHPHIIPHLSPYSPLITTSTTSSPHPAHIVATPTSLNISSEDAAVPTSHFSPPLSSSSSAHPPSQSPHKTGGVLRQIGVVPPSTELYLGGASMNGVQTTTAVRMKQEASDSSVQTPTSAEEMLLSHQRGGGGGGGVVKSERDKPYKCDHPGCERSFSFPAHLRSHIQQIHISYRPCKCEFPGCGKRFYTPQHLNVHRRVHTGERPFVCPYADCCKAFTTAGNLKNHIRTHTGERPYACKFEGCMKRFAEMSSLKKHELTHTGEKPYKCRVCGKAFSQAGSRNTHERKHNRTEGEEVVSEGKVGRRYRIKRIPAASSYKPNPE